MTPVECGHLVDSEALGGSDDRRVDGAERQIAVRGDELGDPQPIAGWDVVDREGSTCKIAEKPDLRFYAEARCKQIRDLGDDQDGNDEGTWVGLEEVEARRVMAVVGIDVGVQRSRVDDEPCYRLASAERISSMRSETSLRPLRPAFAAARWRRPRPPTRYASSASRFSSEIVVPRRSASCLRRASRSSGIFNVVRFMYASIPLSRRGVERFLTRRLHDSCGPFG
jgi:hypothetical protein